MIIKNTDNIRICGLLPLSIHCRAGKYDVIFDTKDSIIHFRILIKWQLANYPDDFRTDGPLQLCEAEYIQEKIEQNLNIVFKEGFTKNEKENIFGP